MRKLLLHVYLNPEKDMIPRFITYLFYYNCFVVETVRKEMVDWISYHRHCRKVAVPVSLFGEGQVINVDMVDLMAWLG